MGESAHQVTLVHIKAVSLNQLVRWQEFESAIHLDDHAVPEVLAADEWSSTSPPILQPLTKSSPTNPASPQASDYELVPLVAHLCFCQMTAWKLESNSSDHWLLSLAFTCLAEWRDVGSRRRKISCNTSSMLRRNRSWNLPIVTSVGSLRAVRVADQCLNCLLKIPSQERCRAQLDRYWTGLAVVFYITEMAHWPIFTQTPNLLPKIKKT